MLADRTLEPMTVTQFQEQTTEYVEAFTVAIESGQFEDITQPEFENLPSMIDDISACREGQKGGLNEERIGIIRSNVGKIEVILRDLREKDEIQNG